MQALATDPGNSRVLLVLLRSGSLYRSSDGGVSFRPLSSRVGGTPWALALTQVNHLVAGNMSSGNYVSTNGSRWHDTGFVDPRGSDMVMEYAVQPTDPSRVLMTSYGVLMSSDGGTSWHVVLKSAVMFGPIAWAPRDPASSTPWVGTGPSGAARTAARAGRRPRDGDRARASSATRRWEHESPAVPRETGLAVSKRAEPRRAGGNLASR